MARQYGIPGFFGAFLNETNPRLDATTAAFVNETWLTNATPGVGSLVFTGFAPSFVILGTRTTYATAGNRAGRSAVVSETGTLSFVTALPAVVTETWDTSVTVAPGAGAIVLTGFAPSAIGDATVSPGVGSIVFTGAAPSTTTNTVVSPAAGAIIFTGAAPSTTIDGVVSPGAGAIVFTGAAPAVDAAVAPAAGAITLTGFAPTPQALSAGGPMFAMIV